MNRPDRLMDDEMAKALLKTSTYGVLSVVCEDGAPYGVPMNYYYSEKDGALFFHCAKIGMKLDALRHEPRVSFVAVGQSDIDAPHFTTRFQSVIVQGHASVVEDDAEMRLRLRELCEVLTPGQPRRDAVIESYLPRVAMIRLDIDSITGKTSCG